jgi:hypothetical protein
MRVGYHIFEQNYVLLIYRLFQSERFKILCLHDSHIAWHSIQHFHVFGKYDTHNFMIVYKVSLLSLPCHKFVNPSCYYRLTEIWHNVCDIFCESFWETSIVEGAHTHCTKTYFPLKRESRQ